MELRVNKLSNEALMKLIQEYYENKLTVNELLKKYKVEGSSKFLKSVELYDREPCEVCGGKVKYILESRLYCNSIDELKKVCTECCHDGNDTCSCKKCVDYRNFEEQKKTENKKQILEKYLDEEPVSINDLYIEELIFIGILKELDIKYRIGVLAENDYFKNIHLDRIASMLFLKQLYKNKIIKVDVDSSGLDNFIIEPNKCISFNRELISYNLNLQEKLDDINVREELFNKYSMDEIVEYWINICLEECMYYLDIRVSALKMDTIDNEIRKDISSYIKELLISYSVSEILCIIYFAVNYALRFKIEYNYESIRVSKAIYTNIRNYIKKEYKIKSFYRPDELISTTSKEYFCKFILECDSDEAFRKNISQLGFNEFMKLN